MMIVVAAAVAVAWRKTTTILHPRRPQRPSNDSESEYEFSHKVEESDTDSEGPNRFPEEE